MSKKEKIKEEAQATSEDVKAVITSKQVAFAFSKAQIVKSKRYAHRRDALNALLKDEKKYSFKQVDEILEKFDKGGKSNARWRYFFNSK